MRIQSKYAKGFDSNMLTDKKYNELHSFATYLRDFKNVISEEVRSDLMFYKDIPSLQFVTLMRQRHPNVVGSSFDKQLYQDVIDCYKNKFEAIQKHLEFKVRTFKGFEFYKRDTKKNKKGDLKKVSYDKKSTPLSICLTYLARYGHDKTVEFITEQLPNLTDENKTKYYTSILNCITKFGFDRLFSLAMAKRQRIVNRYNQKAIEFASLTFRGRCRKTTLVDANKNKKSIIKCFIRLSGFQRPELDIPVKFARSYHDNLEDYRKNCNSYEYTITFNEKRKTVTVIVCKDGERSLPDITANDSVVGIDVNVKHNLFSLSNGRTYDYDRKLLETFCQVSKLVDDRKKQNKGYKPCGRIQHKLHVLKDKMLKREQQLIADMCKELRHNGVRHVVMENLDGGFGRSFVRDKTNEGLNYNRIVKFLGISSLKDEVVHIAKNYDIGVSFVHACYTSKMCPVCGCIEDENRPDQEHFSCVECGHEDNADVNAAKNIRDRVLVTVLRDALLKKQESGIYRPKRLKRESVKKTLQSYKAKTHELGCVREDKTNY